MRYVAPTFHEQTLRSGRSLEQFLGGGKRDGEDTIRIIELLPRGASVEVWLHEAADIGDEERLDYYPFIFSEDVNGEPTKPAAVLPTAAAALEYARLQLGASDDRWTNNGVSQDEYLDFIKAGRPSPWPSVA